uniref:Uncharacterized protein n=1 Tax=Poecilia mexicana TaxID=48701 RepID=A0A3B3Y201_9TELE
MRWVFTLEWPTLCYSSVNMTSLNRVIKSHQITRLQRVSRGVVKFVLFNLKAKMFDREFTLHFTLDMFILMTKHGGCGIALRGFFPSFGRGELRILVRLRRDRLIPDGGEDSAPNGTGRRDKRQAQLLLWDNG